MPTPPIIFPLIHGNEVPIPVPLAGTLDAIQSMVTTMDEQEADEVRDRIVRRVIILLQDSGVSREHIDEEDFERSMNSLTSDSFPVVKAKVRGFYEHVMRATTVPPRATFIFPVAIRSELEYRLAMNILRSSSNFTSLRDEKIWTMTDDTLISRLTLANTCARETTWYDVLRHVLGFKNPDAVSADVIRTDVLRDFLADYVFGVGRTVTDKEVGPLHPVTSPQVTDSVEGQNGSTSIKVSLKGVRISSELPPLTHISELTGVETEVFELRYGYDGTGDKSSPESYNIFVGIIPEEIDKKRGKVGAFQTLQRIMIKLFGDELNREHDSSEGRHKNRTRWIPQVPRTRREKVIQVATRPQYLAMPEIDTIPDYPALITWLVEEEKKDVANKTTSLRSVLLDLRKKKLSQLFSETKILESFAPASLGRQVLLLALFLDASKTLAQFLEDVYTPAQMGKPVQTWPKEAIPIETILPPTPIVSTTPTGNSLPGLSSPSKPTSPSKSRMIPTSSSASSTSPFRGDTRYHVPRSGQRHGHTGAWKSHIARTPSPSSLPPALAKPALVPTETHIPELPEKKGIEVPESVIDLTTAGDWLRAQAQWATIFQTLEKKDDLAIASYLQGHDGGLLRVFIELKKMLRCTSTALVASVIQKSDTKEILEQGEISQEASPVLRITPEHEQKVKTMFALHQAGKYREFYDEYHALNGTPTFDEIREVALMLGSDKDTLGAIAFIAGADMPADQKNLYALYTWDKNLRNFPHVKTVCERLLGKGSDAKKFAVIAKDLDLTVRVPIDRTEWLGFEAKIAPEGTTLLQIVEGLVKLDGGDPTSTKQILRKVKLILGRTD